MPPVTGASIRECYLRDGFHVHGEPVLSADLVDRAVAGMDAVRRGEYDTDVAPEWSPWKPGDDPDVLCKIEMGHLASRALTEVARHAEIGRLAAALTKARLIQVWWVQLLHKPPYAAGAATSVGWHQDATYWDVWDRGSEVFTCWVALSDVRQDCGAMRFVPGSHRWGRIAESDFFRQDRDAQLRAIDVPDGCTWSEAPDVLPAGGVSFHHRMMLHGSGPNRSGSPRRSLALHLRTENSRPVGDQRQGLARFIDDHERCPVIFQA